MTYAEHFRHSSLVRNWRAKSQKDAFGLDWTEGKTCSLRSPSDGFLVQVSFSRYVDHPEFVRIRASNWRAEHEPNGVYSAKDAEAFYRQLKAAGFVPVTP